MANFKVLTVLGIGMKNSRIFGSSELLRASSSTLLRETQGPSKVERLINPSPYKIATFFFNVSLLILEEGRRDRNIND